MFKSYEYSDTLPISMLLNRSEYKRAADMSTPISPEHVE